ncbi:hypothetical protein ABZ208_15350 [Streptomyces sp. NPDC006208]|uniref:hypothetical protein n=1 Tax=Streptomyces sp. NPDC006208 TaxID=3156734 RepID=UPI0033A3C2E8
MTRGAQRHRREPLTVDGKPLTCRIRLTADHAPVPGNRVSHGERRLVVLCRDDLWAVRDFDPQAGSHGLPGHRGGTVRLRRAVQGHFRADERDHSIRVENTEGRERGLGLCGEIVFDLDGEERTLKAPVGATDRCGRPSPTRPAVTAATASGFCGRPRRHRRAR